MTAHRKTAVAVGLLIIAGYLTYGIGDAALIQPLLGGSDTLANVSANTAQLTTGALIMAMNSFAVVGIGVLLLPILKQFNKTIAFGYLATRLFEGIVMAGGIISLLLLVPLAHEFTGAGAANAGVLHALSNVAVEGNLLAYQIAMIGLSIGSLPLAYLLYRTRLVPRIIPVLGLVGYPALLAIMAISTYVAEVSPALFILYVPGMLFEIGLALWLVFKGFHEHALAPRTSGER